MAGKYRATRQMKNNSTFKAQFSGIDGTEQDSNLCQSFYF
jgi:hypothetical protein